MYKIAGGTEKHIKNVIKEKIKERKQNNIKRARNIEMNETGLGKRRNHVNRKKHDS